MAQLVRLQLTEEENDFYRLLLFRVINSEQYGQPFLRRAFHRLIPVSVLGSRTMSIDKNYYVYIDFTEMIQRGPDYAAGILNHEIWHPLRNHHEIMENLPPAPFGYNQALLANLAADLEINDDIADLLPITAVKPLRSTFKNYDESQTLITYYKKMLNDLDNVAENFDVELPNVPKQGQKSPQPPQGGSEEDSSSSGNSDQSDSESSDQNATDENSTESSDGTSDSETSEESAQNKTGQKTSSNETSDNGSSAEEESSNESEENSDNDGSESNDSSGQESSSSSDGDSESDSGSGEDANNSGESSSEGKGNSSNGFPGSNNAANPPKPSPPTKFPKPAPPAEPKDFWQNPNCGSVAGNPQEYELPEDDVEEMTDDERETLIQKVAGDIKDYEEELKSRGNGVGSGRGSLLSKISKWAKDKLKAKHIPWKQQLRGQFLNVVASVRGKLIYVRNRPARRQPVKDIMYPALKAPNPTIGVAIDISGSNLGNLRVILGELYNIMKATGVRGKDIQAFAVDVATSKPQIVHNPLTLLDNLPVGGGTRMKPGYKKLAELGQNISILITDGYVDDYPKEKPKGKKKTTFITCIVLDARSTKEDALIKKAEKVMGKWSKIIPIFVSEINKEESAY